MSRILAVALALAVLPALAASANAAERDTSTTTISLRGVNIGTAAGAELLQARLRAAVRQVCGVADAKDLQATADMNACREAALQQAAPQLLTALAASRNSQVAAR